MYFTAYRESMLCVCDIKQLTFNCQVSLFNFLPIITIFFYKFPFRDEFSSRKREESHLNAKNLFTFTLFVPRQLWYVIMNIIFNEYYDFVFKTSKYFALCQFRLTLYPNVSGISFSCAWHAENFSSSLNFFGFIQEQFNGECLFDYCSFVDVDN